MEDIINYDEIFKAQFDDDKLDDLIARSDADEVEHEFNREELSELMRLEGRRRMDNLRQIEEIQREMDELDKG